jgi:hypothetical protein
MSKQTEDTMYEIHIKLEEKGLTKKFHKQLEKMQKEGIMKFHTVAERWEYAYKIVKEKYAKTK